MQLWFSFSLRLLTPANHSLIHISYSFHHRLFAPFLWDFSLHQKKKRMINKQWFQLKRYLLVTCRAYVSWFLYSWRACLCLPQPGSTSSRKTRGHGWTNIVPQKVICHKDTERTRAKCDKIRHKGKAFHWWQVTTRAFFEDHIKRGHTFLSLPLPEFI